MAEQGKERGLHGGPPGGPWSTSGCKTGARPYQALGVRSSAYLATLSAADPGASSHVLNHDTGLHILWMLVYDRLLSQGSPKVTYDQCRAARAILNLTQPALARLASVDIKELRAFETGKKELSPELIGKLRSALIPKSIDFLNDEDGIGILRRDTFSGDGQRV